MKLAPADVETAHVFASHAATFVFSQAHKRVSPNRASTTGGGAKRPPCEANLSDAHQSGGVVTRRLLTLSRAHANCTPRCPEWNVCGGVRTDSSC